MVLFFLSVYKFFIGLYLSRFRFLIRFHNLVAFSLFEHGDGEMNSMESLCHNWFAKAAFNSIYKHHWKYLRFKGNSHLKSPGGEKAEC